MDTINNLEDAVTYILNMMSDAGADPDFTARALVYVGLSELPELAETIRNAYEKGRSHE